MGYHGCDAVIRDDLVKGTIKCLNSSKNDYDWLGPGFYLFENDPVRAQKLAEASRAHPERMYTKEPIATPAVVGVVLRVQRWLDMTTQDGLQRFADAHRKIGELFQAAHQDLPVNGSAGSHDTDFILRRLDNAVFHVLHQAHDEAFDGDRFFQAVRGAFPQGDYITPNSFRTDSHIQIAVRDPDCVLGWFLPEGAKLMDPEMYAAGAEMLAAAKKQRKPKKRA